MQTGVAWPGVRLIHLSGLGFVGGWGRFGQSPMDLRLSVGRKWPHTHTHTHVAENGGRVVLKARRARRVLSIKGQRLESAVPDRQPVTSLCGAQAAAGLRGCLHGLFPESGSQSPAPPSVRVQASLVGQGGLSTLLLPAKCLLRSSEAASGSPTARRGLAPQRGVSASSVHPA